ncbi:MAG: hypothetical protein PHW02_06460 [bacterium]|nr:hypothetical protein [bacterium]
MREKLKEYMKRIDHSLFGEPEEYNKSVLGSVCDTTSEWKDVLSVYLNVNEGKILSMGAKCGPCDPAAYVVLYGLMKVLPGMNFEEVHPCNSSLKNAFSKESQLPLEGEVLEHYQRIVKIIADLLTDGRNEKPVCECKISLE